MCQSADNQTECSKINSVSSDINDSECIKKVKYTYSADYEGTASGTMDRFVRDRNGEKLRFDFTGILESGDTFSFSEMEDVDFCQVETYSTTLRATAIPAGGEKCRGRDEYEFTVDDFNGSTGAPSKRPLTKKPTFSPTKEPTNQIVTPEPSKETSLTPTQKPTFSPAQDVSSCELEVSDHSLFNQLK